MSIAGSFDPSIIFTAIGWIAAIIGTIGTAIQTYKKNGIKAASEYVLEKINLYINPTDTTTTSPPKELDSSAYLMGDEVKESIKSNVPESTWLKFIEVIESNESAGVYTYVLNSDEISIKIMDGKIVRISQITGAGGIDQTEYDNKGIDIYAAYSGVLDVYNKGFPSEPIDMLRNTRLFVNIRHSKDAKFVIKAEGEAQEYGETYVSYTTVDEGENPTYKEGVGNYAYPIFPPAPNGWWTGEYNIKITVQQTKNDLGEVYQKIEVPVKVVFQQ